MLVKPQFNLFHTSSIIFLRFYEKRESLSREGNIMSFEKVRNRNAILMIVKGRETNILVKHILLYKCFFVYKIIIINIFPLLKKNQKC